MTISDIKHKELGVEIYFYDPYTLKIVFENNTFSINDHFFEILVENQEFKDIQKLYEIASAEKYLNLSTTLEPTVDEKNLLDNMTGTFLYLKSVKLNYSGKLFN